MFKLQQLLRLFALTALLSALVTVPVSAAQHKLFAPGSAVTIVLEDEYYPFSYKSDHDSPESERQGFDAGFAQLLCREMNWQCTLKPLPFADIIPAVESGKADLAVAGLTYSDERQKTLAFTRPYYRSRPIFIGRIGHPVDFNYHSAAGLKIGTQRGSVQADALDDLYAARNYIKLYENYRGLFAALAEGDLDAILVDGLSGYHYLKSKLGSNLELLGMFNEFPMPIDNGCVALSKQHAAELPLINNAITKILLSADYQMLSLQYFPFINY